ncbi:hypothetical protein GQ44DRAFT_700175 [Phaeosphaeriaceae sp. PMI808]|nr:hypothetical protein GQ44DRAFT_700175 [Phaeosphaeriaceae sp. PMI808]
MSRKRAHSTSFATAWDETRPAKRISTSSTSEPDAPFNGKERAWSVNPRTPPHLIDSQALDPQQSPFFDCPPALRLTQENLRLFEHITQSATMSRNPSPTRNDSTMADLRQLEGYNITVDIGVALPEALGDFVKGLREQRDQPPSPHARAIVMKRRDASLENEIGSREMMEEHILFRGEGYADGIRGIQLKNQVNLIKEYLPQPPRATALELWGSLARPQPDSCIGYIPAARAARHTPPFFTPFTREESEMADWYNVVHNADTHFPFLTAQWKAAISGENQIHASLQAARDGAVIVNYMHHFYALAYPSRQPTQIETCHFSVTTEGYTIMVWIHWREVNSEDGEVYYRMEPVETARMNEIGDLHEVRKLLHNLVDYAMGERVRSIKEALPLFWPNRPVKKAKSSKAASSSTASRPELRLDLPMTPMGSMGEGAERVASHPKKRLRDAQ